MKIVFDQLDLQQIIVEKMNREKPFGTREITVDDVLLDGVVENKEVNLVYCEVFLSEDTLENCSFEDSLQKAT